MTETTKTTRRPKAAAEPAPEAKPVAPTVYAKVAYNHKPSNGDMAAITPRLLDALAPQLGGKTLADVNLAISVTKDEAGNYQVFVTA